MKKVYFVDETDIKNNTVVNLNVESNLINTAISDAQLISIQPILGSKLYKAIQAKIVDGSITGSTQVHYKELLDDYIIPATIQATVAEILPFINFKLMNKSVGQQSSDNTAPVDLDTIKYLQGQATNKSEFLCQRMADYLMANYNLFPEYHNQTAIDDLLPNTTAYFCGIEMGGGNNCSDYSKELINKTGYNNIG